MPILYILESNETLISNFHRLSFPKVFEMKFVPPFSIGQNYAICFCFQIQYNNNNNQCQKWYENLFSEEETITTATTVCQPITICALSQVLMKLCVNCNAIDSQSTAHVHLAQFVYYDTLYTRCKWFRLFNFFVFSFIIIITIIFRFAFFAEKFIL